MPPSFLTPHPLLFLHLLHCLLEQEKEDEFPYLKEQQYSLIPANWLRNNNYVWYLSSGLTLTRIKLTQKYTKWKVQRKMQKESSAWLDLHYLIIMPFFLCLIFKGMKLRCPYASWWRQTPKAYSRSSMHWHWPRPTWRCKSSLWRRSSSASKTTMERLEKNQESHYKLSL